jgi:hypothetical protein
MSFFMKVVSNPVMKALLRSPLHALMSKSTAVITLTGRRIGNAYSLPVKYQQKEDIVWITSKCDRSWWKNFQEGATVFLRLAGKQFEGWEEVFEMKEEVQD